eukprot:m.16309 g.16309  ORF g.16309 m.16309 type:complete len:283 (+) comp3490_c1_seq1:862-1710(+)
MRRAGQGVVRFGAGAQAAHSQPQMDSAPAGSNSSDSGPFMGWLVKRGRVRHSWIRRYFVLEVAPAAGAGGEKSTSPAASLVYYENDARKAEKGRMALTAGWTVYYGDAAARVAQFKNMSWPSMASHDSLLVVETDGRTLYTYAESSADCDAWIAQFRALGDGRVTDAAESVVKVDTTVPLFKDKFCIVYADRIEILTYFFPFGGSKIIPFSEIVAVEAYTDQSMFTTKAWGMALNDIWWACDMRIPSRRTECALVIDCGAWPRKGFSTTDRDTVLSLIRQDA